MWGGMRTLVHTSGIAIFYHISVWCRVLLCHVVLRRYWLGEYFCIAQVVLNISAHGWLIGKMSLRRRDPCREISVGYAAESNESALLARWASLGRSRWRGFVRLEPRSISLNGSREFSFPRQRIDISYSRSVAGCEVFTLNETLGGVYIGTKVRRTSRLARLHCRDRATGFPACTLYESLLGDEANCTDISFPFYPPGNPSIENANKSSARRTLLLDAKSDYAEYCVFPLSPNARRPIVLSYIVHDAIPHVVHMKIWTLRIFARVRRVGEIRSVPWNDAARSTSLYPPSSSRSLYAHSIFVYCGNFPHRLQSLRVSRRNNESCSRLLKIHIDDQKWSSCESNFHLISLTFHVHAWSNVAYK